MLHRHSRVEGTPLSYPTVLCLLAGLTLGPEQGALIPSKLKLGFHDLELCQLLWVLMASSSAFVGHEDSASATRGCLVQFFLSYFCHLLTPYRDVWALPLALSPPHPTNHNAGQAAAT